MVKEYKGIHKISGSLIVIKNTHGATVGDMAEVHLQNGEVHRARVLEVNNDHLVAMLYDSGCDISPSTSKFRVPGKPFELPMSEDMLGRVFNGMGTPIDNGPEILAEVYKNISPPPANPLSRVLPTQFIQTGISAIDAVASIACGQKIAVFSAGRIPHVKLLMQLAKQATTLGADADRFTVVIGAIGITFEESEYIINEVSSSDAVDRSVLFINTASDPIMHRIAAPRVALTAAEYLAFTKGRNVLVLLTDMTNYCEALRELSIHKREPSLRYGYPAYLRYDLASIYERAGKYKTEGDTEGSITLIPFLTMPCDDFFGPIADITSETTEGKIVLSPDLLKRGISPPIDVCSTLSYLKSRCTGTFKTREDHTELVTQLVAAYVTGRNAIKSISKFGETAFTDYNLQFARFADGFETRLINQGYHESKSINTTLDLGWELLSTLPRAELKKISNDLIEKYMP